MKAFRPAKASLLQRPPLDKSSPRGLAPSTGAQPADLLNSGLRAHRVPAAIRVAAPADYDRRLACGAFAVCTAIFRLIGRNASADGIGAFLGVCRHNSPFRVFVFIRAAHGLPIQLQLAA